MDDDADPVEKKTTGIEMMDDEDSVELHEGVSALNLFKGSPKQKKILIIALVSALIILLIVVLLTLAIVLVVVLTGEQDTATPPDYFHTSDVRDSCEFQIGLRPEEDWSDRDKMINIWMSEMNTFSSLLHFTLDNAEEPDIYTQFHLTTSGKKHCGTSDDLKTRVRSYLIGGYSTIDIKGGEPPKSKTDSCSIPFWPAESFYNTTAQKCEEDVHPCFTKFTRGSSVKLPFPHFTVDSCETLADLFPDVFQIDDDNRDNDVPAVGGGYWFKQQWKGISGNHTNYQVQFTIEYFQPIPDILNQNNLTMIEGEWSLRFWVEPGLMWEMDVVEDFETLFYKLVLRFDTYSPDHFDCAYNYLYGEREGVGINLEEHADVVPSDELQ